MIWEAEKRLATRDKKQKAGNERMDAEWKHEQNSEYILPIPEYIQLRTHVVVRRGNPLDADPSH